MRTTLSAIVLLTTLCLHVLSAASPASDAARYAAAIDQINAAHLRKPGRVTEDELRGQIPQTALRALDRVLKARPSPETADALLKCGEAALDLADMERFQRIRERLQQVDPDRPDRIGDAVARDRFLVRGIGDFEAGYLNEFANVTEAILEAYDEVFGFKEWSKVAGKKIRIRIHLVPEITRPPHFAPQYPYHSEIDMPVVDDSEFRSPTPKGQMMFYGLCHELGHLIAMWGDRDTMEDHHAWAHYTGVTIVEHMSVTPKYRGVLEKLRDAQWRSLSLERRNQGEPSMTDRAGVLATLIRLHDVAGPRSIGAALNYMEKEAMGHRINHVRYYRFKDLRQALDQTIDDRQTKAAVGEVLP
ncbi:hypothetical protein [Haloferula sargassicola]|uniref:Uncharacterized protein n=1 Tax=Haloferula sargassicola TaxID=490096 RepID=A0ABP9UT62_9BACT